MKNITQLRDELAEMFNGLKAGTTEVKVAAEMNNTAGKIINTLKVELEYAELRNVTPAIPFLNAE